MDRAIESFRADALGLDLYDPLTDEAPEHLFAEEIPPFGDETSERETALQPPLPASVELKILGPVEVVGWRSPPERAIVTELLCYLALHRDGPVSGEAIRAALRPDGDREQSAKTMRTYLSSLRRSLGPEALPTGSGGGYRLADSVATDWERFQRATRRGDLDARLEAMRLVRGRPFEAVPSGTYGWVFSEFLISDIEVAVSDVAKDVARQCREQGQVDTALWALRQGLLAAGSDFGLWERYVLLSGELGPDALQRAERQARAALGEDALIRDTPASG